MTALLKKLAAEELKRRQVLKPLATTLSAMQWRDPHIRPVAWQAELAALCDNVVTSSFNGHGTRQLVSAPPRHGKTETIGRGMPLSAYARASKPFGILYSTSTDTRAEEVSFRVKSGIERLYEQTGDVRFKPGRKWTTTDWETEFGHTWVGMGWAGATGGIGCNLLILDDQIGTSQVYRSKSKRDNIKRVIQEDLLSRVMDGGAVLDTETRRGKDDTTEWLKTHYPGVWSSHVWQCFDPERGYLWPEKYGEEWRASMPHLTESSPIWRAVYQQEPVSEGGTLIEPEWTSYLLSAHVTPEMARTVYKKVIIGCDLAASGKKQGDDTSLVVIGVNGEKRDILEVYSEKVAFLQQKEALKGLCHKWGVTKAIVERAAGGDAMVDSLRSELRNVLVEGVFPYGDKVTRLTPFLGLLASGQVRINPGCSWYSAWKAEMDNFTGVDGESDNRVDATVWALYGCEEQADERFVSVEDVQAAFRQVWR